MFSIDDLAGLPLTGDILREIADQHPKLEPGRHAHELVRRVITRMIEDVIVESRARLVALAPRSVDAVREAAAPMVAFTPAMAEADRAIKGFLYQRLYRQDRIMAIMGEAENLVRRLFDHYCGTPSDLPADWLADIPTSDEGGRAIRIADYIAGMTDRFAIVEHARIFGSAPELR